jgi:hypothetical protein
MADHNTTKHFLMDILDSINPKNVPTRNRAGQIVKNTNDIIPVATEGLGLTLRDAARGTFTGVAGMPGDISEAVRSLTSKGRNRAGQAVNPNDILGERYFPTSEELQNRLGYEQSVPLKLGQHVVAPFIGPGEIVKGIQATKDMPLGLSMIGPKSKLWNKEMAKTAQKMEKGGAKPDEIREATGMVRGLDNQWRDELSDQFAKMKNSEKANFGRIHKSAKGMGDWETYIDKAEKAKYGENGPDLKKMTDDELQEHLKFRSDKFDQFNSIEQKPVKLKNVLEHQDLYDAYPHLRNIEVVTHKGGGDTIGAYYPGKNKISISEDLTPEEAKSTLLHELTHDIQHYEGWNHGANSRAEIKKYFDQKEQIMDQIIDLNRQMSAASKAGDMDKYHQIMEARDVLSKQHLAIDPYKMGMKDYLNNAGEAEARLVQARMNLPPEELIKHFPYEYTGAGKGKYGLDIQPDEARIVTKTPDTIDQPTQSIDLSKIPTKEEYEAMVNKGQMRQARTFNQDLEDTLAGKVPGNKFEIPTHSNHAFDYEMGDFTKKLEDAGLHVYDNKYGTVYAGKTAKDLELIKNAETPLEHGLSFGYTPEDIARFYTNRRGGNPEIGYAEYLDDLKHVQSKYAPSYENYDYRGSHKAPKKDDYHVPAHDLTTGGMYSDDIYGDLSHHYYGTGDRRMDRDTLRILKEARGNPDHEITIYRAVPGEFAGAEINPGDWVTPNMDYATEHGLRFDSHHILEKRVPARHIYTNADSIHEFGYDPFD